MCEANAYWVRDDEERLIMEAVELVTPDVDGTWRLVNLFGEEKSVRGRVKAMNLADNKILFEETAA